MPVSAIDRRTAVKLLGLSLALPMTAPDAAAQPRTSALAAMDHLLLGIDDLDRGIAWIAERTGVKAAIGGSHPGRGTRNALLSLGPRQYLEIIAPDPAQTTFTFQIDIRTMKEPRLINWAATGDVDRVAALAKAAGIVAFGPSDGSRARPDGKMLTWRSLGIASSLAAGIVQPIPFFIQWAAGTVHPAQDSPGGCELKAFRLTHPSPAAVRDQLAAIGIDADVASSSEAALQATISTPKGPFELR